MATSATGLEAIQDIKKMMERSSRFISLSGWSGISAGVCALAGAFAARQRIAVYQDSPGAIPCADCLRRELLLIAVVVFIVAFCSAGAFTWVKARKDGVKIWGKASRRLLWNTLLPMVAGGFVLWRMIGLAQYDLLAAGSLIFYGLALVNGSKYTMGEVRYLGYAQIITGIAGLWLPGSGLYVWATGFGLWHIVYGIAMWWKYERSAQA
ncbi:MAG: hypothetical protein JNL51_18900 [Chitinophagaceae bacterium]|nr:hypothetical protein [Chitinophagaceae bacterium]